MKNPYLLPSSFALVLLILFFLNTCSQPYVGEGIVIYTDENVKIGANPARVSQKILSEQNLSTAESMVHIQFTHEEEYSVALNIIKEKSEFSFAETNPKKNKNLTFFLRTGSGSFRYMQIAEKISYTLETPAMAMFGTKGDFQVSIGDNGDTTIHIITGIFNGYRLLPPIYFEKIPRRIFSEASDLKDTIALWKAETFSMKAGNTYTISIADNMELARKARLDKILEEAMSYSDLQSAEPNKKDLAEKTFIDRVQKVFKLDANTKKQIEAVLKSELPFKMEKLSTAELSKKLKEIEGLTHIDPKKIMEAKNLEQLIMDRNEAIKITLMNTVAVNKSGNVGKLKTNDGRDLDCVIYTDPKDSDFYFCDPVVGKGIEKFHKKTVKKISFTE